MRSHTYRLHNEDSRRRGGASAGSHTGTRSAIPPPPAKTRCISCGRDGIPKDMHAVGDRYQHHYICDICWKETSC
jgi:hypothetical protein